MAVPNQIVYRLEDYRVEGGYITTPSNMDIHKEIVSQMKMGNFSKLGIQAPPGTKFQINGIPIMMGRTGIYELDEDVQVATLVFEQVPNYKKDDEATGVALSKGISLMKEAKKLYETYITVDADTNIEKYPGNMENGDYTTQYWLDYQKVMIGGTLSNGTVIESGYNTLIENARSQLLQGANGIYKAEGTKELNNVIIDFLTEEGGSGN